MPKVCPVCGASYTDDNVFCPTDGSSLRAADAEGDLIGTVIADRYLVTDLLGEGGMGKVFLARHVRLPQQAAIKVLRPAMLRDPDAVARFNREAANASRIEHERIARVFDYGESSDGTVYLAMEYVPGRTLKALLTAEGPQRPERAARITRQVADALDAAHRLEIVHRDLKPDNVMVIEDDVLGDRCKVVDFGIAKALGADSADGPDGGLTKTGFVVGTPEFMSPEQLLGAEIDHRSDVYALALLSYQCFTGALPFDGATPERAMTARLMETPQSLAGAMPDVRWPVAMEQVFAKGLAREVEQRYDSAGAFARELEAAVSAWHAEVQPPAATTVATPPAGAPLMGGAVAPANAAANAAAHRATANAGSPPAGAAASSAASSPAARSTAAAASGASPNRTPLFVGGVLTVAAVAVAAFMLRPSADTAANPDAATPAPASVAAAEPPPAAAPVETPATIDDATDTGTGSGDRAGETSRSTGGTGETPTASPQETRERPQRATQEPQAASLANTPQVPATSSTLSPGDAARATLDSIRSALDPLTASESDARTGVAALRSLMPRLVNAQDSAWAYLREAEAHFLMNDERSACLALRAATPLVRTNGQRGVLSTMSGALSVTCGD